MLYLFVRSKSLKHDFDFYLVLRAPTVQAEKPNADANMNKIVQKTKQKLKVPTIKDLIDAAFQNELGKFYESKQHLKVGDAVVARMKGFLPWPGRIESFSSNNKIINCFFLAHVIRAQLVQKTSYHFLSVMKRYVWCVCGRQMDTSKE